MEELIFTDRAISQEMKMSNYEQFISLVRMHLSFELDLNTDEFDLPCHEVIYYDKGKVKKWNRLSKKIKGCTTGTRTCSPPEEHALCLTPNLIDQLRVLKDFLMRSENIIQEGIFRRTGAVSRQNELRSIMIQRKEFNVVEGYTVHDCAAVFKGCLSELAEPLLTDAHYPAHCQIAELCNAGVKLNSKIKEDHLLHSVQLILLLLPEENRILLEDVINMLHETAKHQTLNKMSPDSLATLFTPHLICPRNLPAEALHYVSQSMSSVISYMIVKGQQIFDIPPKLATDIRAYSLEQTRKKAMSPEQILDLSISDISTVNTVYTFVDREKTAEAHNSNPTDTALAQLYAHIQSLPESSKKRKLIKQFNRENGQGTPLQFLMLNRLKNAGSTRSAKSIGNSIKKHIFQRSIMSRTPKKNIPLTQCDESIMTPRSRKPVMLANTLGFSDSNHPSYDGNLSSFREQDEDSFLNHNLSTQVQASIRSYGEDLLNNEVSGSKESKSERPSTAFSLTNTFREYLLGRSVLTASPVDTSFSSHSDDFGSTPDIRDLNGSEMSSSLLHCLDGNKLDTSLSDSSISNELMTNSLKVKYRKRRNAKSKEIFDEKENDHPNDISHFQPKKVLILETNSNETSL